MAEEQDGAAAILKSLNPRRRTAAARAHEERKRKQHEQWMKGMKGQDVLGGLNIPSIEQARRRERLMAEDRPLESGTQLPYITDEQAKAQGLSPIQTHAANRAAFVINANLPEVQTIRGLGAGAKQYANLARKDLLGKKKPLARPFGSRRGAIGKVGRGGKKPKPKKKFVSLGAPPTLRRKALKKEFADQERIQKMADFREAELDKARLTHKQLKAKLGQKDVETIMESPLGFFRRRTKIAESPKAHEALEESMIRKAIRDVQQAPGKRKGLIDHSKVDDKVVRQKLKESGIENEHELREYLMDNPDQHLFEWMERTGRLQLVRPLRGNFGYQQRKSMNAPITVKALQAKIEKGNFIRHIHAQSKARREMHRDFDQFYRENEDYYDALKIKASWRRDTPLDDEDLKSIAWTDFQEIGGPGFGSPYRTGIEGVAPEKALPKPIIDWANRFKWL